MVLKKETIEEIKNVVYNTELTNSWEEYETEISQGDYIITLKYRVAGKVVEDYCYHSEVLYNCYEDCSYIEMDEAEIMSIEACDEHFEDVEIENLEEVKL